MAANGRIDHETTNLNVKLTKDSIGGTPFKKAPLKLQKGAHLTLIGQFLE